MSTSDGVILKKRYKVLEKLGEGGFSAVYLGEDIQDGSKWAIKEYNISYADPQKNQTLMKQIHFEASILLKLSHYQLPRFKDYFRENDRHYLIMDFIDGKDLNTLINSSNKDIPEIQIIEWGIEIANLLHYLHSYHPEPIIFRDLKPQNIMLTRDGEIKLIDFGISKPIDTATRTTAKAFSPGFSPPEQYSFKGKTDERSDIYSMGATLYFLISRTTPVDALERVMGNNTLVPPGNMRKKPVSTTLDNIVIKCMENKKEDRYQDVREIRTELQKLLKTLRSSSGDNGYDLSDFFPELNIKKSKQHISVSPVVQKDFKVYESYEEKEKKSKQEFFRPIKVNKHIENPWKDYFIKNATDVILSINRKKLLKLSIILLPIILLTCIYYFFIAPSIYMKRAENFMKTKNYEAAEKEYLKVLSVQHNNITAHKNLLIIYLHDERFERSQAEVEIIGKLEPENLEAEYIYAEALYKKALYSRAIEHYKILLNKNSNFYEAYAGLGKSYRANNDYSSAINIFNKGLQLKLTGKQKEELKTELAIIYLQKGKDSLEKKNYKDAMKYFKKVSNYVTSGKILDETKKNIALIPVEPTPVPVRPETYPSYIPDTAPVYNPPPSSNPSGNDIMW